MKLKHTLIFGSLLFVSITTFGQDKKATTKPVITEAAPAQSAEAKAEAAKESAAASEKAWMAYMTPGPMHKLLAQDEGEWSEALTFWMAPGAPPSTAEAKFSCKTIMEGRYQECLHSGEMMGMPFEGRSTVGYNNVTKKFESTWMDNMSTGVMFLTGTMDEKTKTVTYTGKGVDPESGKEIPVRQVFKIVDDNTRVLEMYDTKNGKEHKSMEIKMTRN